MVRPPTPVTSCSTTHRWVIYAYDGVETLLREESADRSKAPLPGPGELPSTERPGS